MFPNQRPHTLNGEQCAYTVHEGRHTFDLTMAEAAAAHIINTLTACEQATLTIVNHALTDAHQLANQRN